MREVELKLRFLTPSLGNVVCYRSDGVQYSMPRDVAGQVVYLPTWWSSLLRYSAHVCGRHQDAVKSVEWSPKVTGQTGVARRYLGRGDGKEFSVHEAFLANSVIDVTCVVPSAISDADLRELMIAAGKYRGISPFRAKGMGRFDVLS